MDPDTEMFYDTGKPKCSEGCNPDCDCGKYVEIWNNVFMKYFKHKDGTLTELKQHNVDTGLGLERMTMLLQGNKHHRNRTICSSNGQVRRTTKSRQY